MTGRTFRPGDRVTILEGAFAGMAGVVLSPAEVAARWPGLPRPPEAERGDYHTVIVQVFGRDVPVDLYPHWMAKG